MKNFTTFIALAVGAQAQLKPFLDATHIGLTPNPQF